MSIYFAGVELCLPKTEAISETSLTAWVEANISTRDVYEFLRHPYWLGENSPPVPFSFAALSEDQPIKLSRLWWPMWGASRWAVGHFLISERIKSAIEQAAPNGGPATLEMQWWDQSSQQVDGITPSLYYLPPRPLQQIPFAAAESGSFYLLTLVDARFWWNVASTTGELIIQEGTTTWANLYNTLAGQLGITIQQDTVNSAYLNPSRVLNRHYRLVPPVLDLIAFSVGQRIVRRLDGTVLARNYANALADQTTNLALASVTRGNHEAGGEMIAGDVNARIPNKIAVAWPKSVSGTSDGTYYSLTSTVTHAGASFTKTFRSQTLATFTNAGDTDPSNKTQLQTMANQVATDYYGWAVANLDVKIAGLVNWKIDGYSDTIEWTHGVGRGSEDYHRQGPAADYPTLDECSTRVQCGPADWGIDLMNGPTPGSPWCVEFVAGSGLEVCFAPAVAAWCADFSAGSGLDIGLASGWGLSGFSTGSTFLKRTVLTSGSSTFTTTSRTNNLMVRLIGGGGGGWGTTGAGSNSAQAGSSGQSGSYTEFLVAASPSTGYSYTVGAGGTGGTAGAAPATGTAGGDTTITVGSVVGTAKGGPTGAGSASIGFLGGFATTPLGTPLTGSVTGGGSGIVTGSTNNGPYGIAMTQAAGPNAGSAQGAGGGQTQFGGAGNGGSNNTAGTDALANTGSGGGGGGSVNGLGGTNGGAGGRGLIIIDEYT